MISTSPGTGAAAAPPRGDVMPDEGRSPLRAYYVFLLLFVLLAVLVIVASIVTQHHAAESFNRLVAQTDDIIDRQVLLDELSRTTLQVNAAGNNIFESRDLHGEKAAFDQHHAELRGHLRRIPADFVHRQALEQHLADMVAAEQRIFSLFEELQAPTTPPSRAEQLVADASRFMAEMDRAQAQAMAVLGDAHKVLRLRHQTIVDQARQTLAQRWLLELTVIASASVFLGAGFLLWRQFQRVHEHVLLEQRRARAERQNRLAAVGEVCFSVAHGIKNPVASIASSAQLVLEYGQLDDASRQRVRELYEVTRSLSERVTQLLNFSRVGAVQRTRLVPQELMEQALREIEPQLRTAGIRVIRDLDAGAAAIEGDRSILVQAVLELLGNAKDALASGGTITVRCAPAEHQTGTVELSVADDGPGMTQDVKNRAFELFFTRKPRGSGVGLATVRRAVELHGGTVAIRDVVPHGADIRLCFPAAGPQPPQQV